MSAAKQWPEHRRCEQEARNQLLSLYPEIWAGVREGHDGGDEDVSAVAERTAVRNWAADMLEGMTK